MDIHNSVSLGGVLVFPISVKTIPFLNNLVVKIMESSTVGIRFIFGRLTLSQGRRARLDLKGYSHESRRNYYEKRVEKKIKKG